MALFFSDISDASNSNCNGIMPIWTVDMSNDDELLQYLNTDFDERINRYLEVAFKYRENMALYKGFHYRSQLTTRRHDNDDTDTDLTKNPKMVFNHIYDLTENIVAMLTRYKPNYTVEPYNQDEVRDKVDAKVLKELIDGCFYREKIEEKDRSLVRGAIICGEFFICVDWDKNKGDEHPLARMVPEEGNQEVTLSDGRTVAIKKSIRMGDVSYKLYTPDRMLMSNHKNYADVDSICRIDYQDESELRAMYPDKSDKICKGSYHYMTVELEDHSVKDTDVMVRTHYYKKSEFLPGGLIIKSTNDCILSVSEMEFDCWPFVRMTDIDVEGELHAESTIRFIKHAQKFFNKIMNHKAKAHGMASLPKWVYPEGAVKIEQLENGVAMKYKGAIAPQLVSYQQGSDQSDKLMDRCERYMEKNAGVFSQSRGAPPPGVTAAVALQFLDEQEVSRNANRFNKRKMATSELANLTGLFISKYYTKEHFSKTLGTFNKHCIKNFDKENFSQRFSCKYIASNALPESKSLRNQTLIEMKREFPGAIKDEQVLDLLEFSQDQKFRDMATVAIRAAEQENEDMMNLTPGPGPQDYQDHIAHYRTHTIVIQESYFEKLDPRIKAMFIDHIRATEMLIFQKMQVNPAYGQLVMQFPMFPMFYKEKQPTPPPMPAGPMGPGTPPPTQGPSNVALPPEQMGQAMSQELQGQGV